MSVLLSKRKESKFEAISYSIEIHDMLIDLMQRSFGVKNLEHFVRMRYVYGKDNVEEHAKYRFLLQNFKTSINQIASQLTNNVRAANSIYPTSLQEYNQRRMYQNNAIVSCEQIIKELQRMVDVFDVDVNLYSRHITAIDREISLIKKWRQKDNKFKSYL